MSLADKQSLPEAASALTTLGKLPPKPFPATADQVLPAMFKRARLFRFGVKPL